MRSTWMNIVSITLAILLFFAALLPLSASMDQQYFVTGACSIDGSSAQGVNIAGPYGAQTVSYPGGNYSLFIRVPDGKSSSVTITASYPGYGNVSMDLDLNQTTAADFNLVRLPVTYTVSGTCRLNGTPSAGVAVNDETYGSHNVSGQDGTYQLNISVPYGETTRVKLIASMAGYEQDSMTFDLNDTLAASFNLPVAVVATALPSSTSGPSAKATANPVNQVAAGLVGFISANAYLLFIVVVLLIVVVAGALFYLKRRSKASKHQMIEPSREDIYKLVTGDTKRTRRTRNDKGRNGGNEKFK